MFKFCLSPHPVCLTLAARPHLAHPLPARLQTHKYSYLVGVSLASLSHAWWPHRESLIFSSSEARDELGERMCITTFGAPGRQPTVELGENDGPANSIFELVLKHNLRTVESHPHKSISVST
ncbi:hypothetical protein H4582DRAFT_1969142 [Lactarius indigo]|nr:hypothetical protein H4582DRAFT_1969142 [Lactarius indigo]